MYAFKQSPALPRIRENTAWLSAENGGWRTAIIRCADALAKVRCDAAAGFTYAVNIDENPGGRGVVSSSEA
jgi:hypothetical protein